MSEIIWFLSFSDWLISLSIMFSRSIHAVAKGKISSFLWLSSIPLCKCPIVVSSTHLLMGTWAVSISWWFPYIFQMNSQPPNWQPFCFYTYWAPTVCQALWSFQIVWKQSMKGNKLYSCCVPMLCSCELIPYDLTYKWNLINKTSKQNITRDTEIKNKLTVTRGE